MFVPAVVASKLARDMILQRHKPDGQWVFGGREKYNKSKIFMIPVNNRDTNTLLAIITKWIAKGSIIHSHGWKAYNQLDKMGCHHVTVNYSKQFFNPETHAYTNIIESDWRHIKVSMPTYGVHKELHASYLAEFLWM